MKKNRFIQGLLLAFTMLAVSCTDFVEPNVPYSEFNTGAYLRTIQRSSVTFSYNNARDFFDVENSRFGLTLEAVDAENGATVETVEIRLRHRRLIPGVGLEYIPAQSSPDILIKTLNRADFAPNDQSRFLRTSFNIPASEALAALGLAATDVERGDVFEFRLILNDRFGRVFTNTNRSPDVGGGVFYDSPFFYGVSVVCPSDIITTAEDTWTATSQSGYGTHTSQVTVRPVSGNAIQFIISDVSAGLYTSFGFNATQEGVYQDACGSMSWVRAGATQFSLADPGEAGSYDAATETLVIPWFDSGNNIRGVTTLTKN